MANASKCDRCGKLYEEYNTENKDTNFNSILLVNMSRERKYFNRLAREVCPECNKEFMEWYHKYGKEINGDDYNPDTKNENEVKMEVLNNESSL